MKKSNMTAMAMAAMMIMANVSPAVVAYADSSVSGNIWSANKVTGDLTAKDEADAKVTGDVTGSVKANGSTVTVGGSIDKGVEATNKSTVTSKDGIGGDVNATNSKVTSEGDISGKVTANGSTVTSDGSIDKGVEATNKSTVTSKDGIGGDVDATDSKVTSEGDINGSVDAKTSSKVESDGDVLGTIKADGSFVTVEDNVDDTDVVKGKGAYTITATGSTSNSAKVEVGGNLVSSDGNAIKLSGENVSVIVKGDVKAEDGISIDVSGVSNGVTSEIAIGGTLENKTSAATLVVDKNNLPEIVVGSIEDLENLVVKTQADEDALTGADREAVISSIKYIIDQEDLENGTLTITRVGGAALAKDLSGNYDVAKTGELLKVKIVAASGYELSKFSVGKDGTAAIVSYDGDGCYTVRMPAGGLNLNAVMKAIEKAEDTKVPEDTKTPETTTTTTTVTRTSSGGGSGSSSSGSHAINVTPGMGRTNLQNTPGSWQKNADNTWSYVGTDGTAYKNNWIVSNNRWYYADANGKITTGWVEINGVWYYFTVNGSSENPEGSMLAGTTTPDGYKLDGNGAWVK